MIQTRFPFNIRAILSMAAFLTAGAVQAQAATDCAVGAVVSSTAQALPPERFIGITPDMSISTVLKLLGPAARDIGSGVYVLEWDVTDGRVFIVSTASLCRGPISIGFHAPALDLLPPEMRIPRP